MPANMNTIGRDYSVELVTPLGTLDIPPDAITGFSVRRRANVTNRKGLSGPPRHRSSPDGYEGSFNVDRFNPLVEDHFAERDAAYYRGENTWGGTIQETIVNPDGTVSQYRYTGVEMNLTDLGDRAPDDEIAMTIEFVAAQRIRIV